MKKIVLSFAALSLVFASFTSCKDEAKQEENEVMTTENVEQTEQETSNEESQELENTQVVPSGTYTGEAIVVDSQQKELYVKLNDTTTIELYFSNDTQVMKNNQQVTFDQIQKGQRLEVEVEKSGESLKPKTVKILE